MDNLVKERVIFGGTVAIAGAHGADVVLSGGLGVNMHIPHHQPLGIPMETKDLGYYPHFTALPPIHAGKERPDSGGFQGENNSTEQNALPLKLLFCKGVSRRKERNDEP